MSITQLTANLNNHQGLGTRPNLNDGLSPEELKTLYDKAPNDIKDYINNVLIPELASATAGSSGAENIGSAPINGVSGATIYAQLLSLKGVVDSMVLGAIPLGSIGVTQLNFDPATQDELNAVNSALTTLLGAKTDQIYSFENRIRSYMGV